ncbi:MAG: hypothetical protein ACI8V2_003903 [Candidatus Latescibacterota bacterium]|jgi:uncharacterized protein YlxW (UPF0749 family)
MSVSGLIALIACMTSILAKIVFSFRIKGLERLSERENGHYQTAKNELYAAVQKQKRLTAEKKQIEGRRNAIQRNIKNTETTLKELQKLKKEDDDLREYQKEMIKGKSH